MLKIIIFSMFFWNPLFRGLGGILGPTVTKTAPKREPKGSQKREKSDSAEPRFLEDPTMVLLDFRVPGGSGCTLFARFFLGLSREGVWRGTFEDFLEF